MNMEEVWRDIDGYEGLYQVSNLGNVRSVDRYTNCGNGSGLKYKQLKKGIMLKPCITNSNYKQVLLCNNGIMKAKKVHRLVAETFIPNPNNLPEVNHKDENKLNNCINNLEWCSSKYNMQYSQAKKINQYDLQNNFIKQWNCMNDIQRELGIKVQLISRVCNGKQQKTHNYIWRFVDVKD